MWQKPEGWSSSSGSSVVIGGALMVFGRLHLPGDLTIRSAGTTIYLPLATSIVLSIVATIVLNLVFRQR